MQNVPRVQLAALRRSISFAACVLMNLLLLVKPSWAQEKQQVRVVEVVWGFDGRVVPGQFMPLSILVDNLSDQPIEATAKLRRMTGMVREVGGQMSQPVFIGPTSRRWVQFYPFISDRLATWLLDLQTEDRTFTFDPMDQPRSVFSREKVAGEPEQTMPAVILDPAGVLTRAPTTIKHMPAEIFPPYATATHGLYALFLDHVPDWEAPRQEALLSWLRSGGRLHLLKDQNNQLLRFSGSLAPLNEPFPEFMVGNGTVVRHEIQREGLVSQIVIPAITPPNVLRTAEEAEEEAVRNRQLQGRGFQFTDSFDLEELLSMLRELTQPKHSWLLISFLSVCYIGLIFPGCWILSKQKTLHYLVTYGAIAGLSVLFSLLFLLIGRRGYNEATSLHTLAIARHENQTHWNLLQYDAFFVTRGDQYQITDNDRQTLFSSGALDEKVDVQTVSGNKALFDARIPPFSSQAIVSRRRVTMDDWQLSILEVAQNGPDISSLSVSFNKNFPVGEGVSYYALHGPKIYTMKADVAGKKLVYAKASSWIRTFCKPVENTVPLFGVRMAGSAPDAQAEEDMDPLEKCFKEALPKLLSRSFLDDFCSDNAKFQVPTGRVRILIYAPVPPSLELSVSTEVRTAGRILFSYELPMEVGNSEPVK